MKDLQQNNFYNHNNLGNGFTQGGQTAHKYLAPKDTQFKDVVIVGEYN